LRKTRAKALFRPLPAKEKRMSFLLMLAATSLLLVALFVTPARDAQQTNAENYIKQSESEWAAAASKSDTSAVK
jgi:hypothetical protein